MSIGIAVLERGTVEPMDDLLARADEAMYAAKKSGRGQFAIAQTSSQKAAS